MDDNKMTIKEAEKLGRDILTLAKELNWQLRDETDIAERATILAEAFIVPVLSRYEARQIGKDAKELAGEIVGFTFHPSGNPTSDEYDEQLLRQKQNIANLLRPYLTQQTIDVDGAANEIWEGTYYTNDFGDRYDTMAEDNIAAIIRKHLTSATATPNAKEQAGTFVVDKETCDKLLPLLEQLREKWPREITVIKNPATPKRVELLEGLLREVLELEKYPTHPMPNELFKRIDQALERIVNGLDKK